MGGSRQRKDFLAPGVYFLVGPTAAGKTAAAHILARRMDAWILSADAFLVYRGMDIGTAKPSAAARAEASYFGLDLVEPREPFSVGAYVRHAAGVLQRAAAEGRRVIVAGGTGLYVKALVEGLAPLPPADAAWRAEAESLLRDGGVEALREEVRRLAPRAYADLRDPLNPRRLVRAVELERAGGLPCRGAPSSRLLTGLRPPAEELDRRIEERVDVMYRDGLLEEARRLRAAGDLSVTAARAIGYAEAFAVLDGHRTQQEAMRQTALRTRQLARRQATWWRNQARVAWAECPAACRTEEAAEAVLAHWRIHGPVPVVF